METSPEAIREALVNALTGVFDQLNPFNTGNLIVYFVWLTIWIFTAVGIWRSQRRWLRLVFFAINQALSVGIVLSWTITALLAWTYWQWSLGAAAASGLLAVWLFRDPRKKQPKGKPEKKTPTRALDARAGPKFEAAMAAAKSAAGPGPGDNREQGR